MTYIFPPVHHFVRSFAANINAIFKLKEGLEFLLGLFGLLIGIYRNKTVRLSNNLTEPEARTLDARIQIERDDWRDDREGERYGYQWHTKRKEGAH